MYKFRDFIFMFLGWDLECTIMGDMFYIEYVILSRLIVLYSQCRVNWGTNLSVVLYYVIFCYCFHCAFGLPCGVPNLWGASPLCCSPLRNHPQHDNSLFTTKSKPP